MKKTIFIFLILFYTIYIHAQSKPFAEWINLHNETKGSISISFCLADRGRDCINTPTSRYRIENTFNEKVKFDIYFSYQTCDGISKEYHDSFSFESAKVDQSSGLWFFGTSELGVHNIRINNLKFPDRESTNQNVNYGNNASKASNYDQNSTSQKGNHNQGKQNQTSHTQNSNSHKVSYRNDVVNTTNNNQNATTSNSTNSNVNSTSWIKLPDGTFYKILPDGMYSFFDGIDQIETVSAIDGKQQLLQHKAVSRQNTNKAKQSKETLEALISLKKLYTDTENQLTELKQSGDADTNLIKVSEDELQKLKKLIDELDNE